MVATYVVGVWEDWSGFDFRSNLCIIIADFGVWIAYHSATTQKPISTLQSAPHNKYCINRITHRRANKLSTNVIYIYESPTITLATTVKQICIIIYINPIWHATLHLPALQSTYSIFILICTGNVLCVCGIYLFFSSPFLLFHWTWTSRMICEIA